MNPVFRIFFVLCLLVTSGIITSCEPDDTNPSDPNDPRNDYVGYWQFTETGKLKSGKTVSQSYIVSISLDEDNSSQLLLNNFANPGVSEKDLVGILTSNQIVISAQTLGNNWTIEGSGKKISDGVMTWNYSILVGGDKVYFTATATKQ